MTQKVTVNPQRTAPSVEIVQEAMQEFSVSDARGRTITLRKPGILAQYRIVEAVGPESAKNEVYMGMVTPILYVASIDGNPVAQPSNKAQIEALIQRLDEAGIVAVVKGVEAHYGTPDPEADKEALKK